VGPARRIADRRARGAAGTPQNLDRVGVLKLGRREARNVLVLNPGTSAGSAYFAPLARTLVSRLHDWQVWSVERRENLLEDHSMLNKAQRGEATPEQLNDYYLGWITDPSITAHFRPIPDSEVAFARRWGMRVEVNDLRRVVLAARRHGRRVVLGGHSLGGSITTAYATWDFHGTAGVRSLADSSTSTAAAAQLRSPPRTRSRSSTILRGARRGSPSAGSPPPSSACSAQVARPWPRSTPAASRSASSPRSCPPT
jgi:pimeloyl-ACP methyl ester carboxylesterase